MYLVANIILHITNLTVFYIFGGIEMMKWALLFSIVIQILPSNTVFINRNSVFSSAIALFALEVGATPVQAFITGGILSLVPFHLMGVVPRIVSPSAILAAGFVVMACHLGFSPLYAYLLGSFIGAKILLLWYLNMKFMPTKTVINPLKQKEPNNFRTTTRR